MAKDRWPELCRLVSEDDGLPTRDVGHWSEEKLYFWNGYVHITTTSMVGKPAWSAGLYYVDLFAGPGVCTLRESGRRLPGSPLIAAYAPKPFDRIIACEKDPELADACKQRLQQAPDPGRCHVLTGDCNAMIGKVADLIPDRALTLAFIDPTGLDARFETIATLADRGRVDLLVLFADAYDIVRNVETYLHQKDSKLDQVLGPDSAWRDKWDKLETRTSTNKRKLFADIYKSQLQRRLGYVCFGERVIGRQTGALYRLVYASKHERGLDFWEKAIRKYPSGQRELPFG